MVRSISTAVIKFILQSCFIRFELLFTMSLGYWHLIVLLILGHALRRYLKVILLWVLSLALSEVKMFPGKIALISDHDTFTWDSVLECHPSHSYKPALPEVNPEYFSMHFTLSFAIIFPKEIYTFLFLFLERHHLGRCWGLGSKSSCMMCYPPWFKAYIWFSVHNSQLALYKKFGILDEPLKNLVPFIVRINFHYNFFSRMVDFRLEYTFALISCYHPS